MSSPGESLDAEGVFASVSALGGGLDGLDGRGLADRLVVLERVIRRAEAAVVAVLDDAEQRGVWQADGHASVRGWAQATVRWSDVEVRDRLRSVRLCRDAALVADELAAGRIGVAQVRELGRARANPRVGSQLVEAIAVLVEQAEAVAYHEFRRCVQRWEAFADVDGAAQGHEAAHAGRRAHGSIVGDEFRLDANGGVVDGAAMIEILRRFEQAQFDAEWADLVARLGDEACASMLERTVAQRRFDALRAIFEQAAAAAPGCRPPEPVLNVVVDVATWQAWLARMAGDDGDGPLPDVDVEVRRCETVDGDQVDPRDAVVAGLAGYVRRVVMDAAGVVIEMGRKVRVFSGSGREAVWLQGGRCLWPGCGRPRTQIDHTVDWQANGGTDPVNAGPMCARHNRHKNRGYSVHRDTHGRWHTTRPDGTDIDTA